MEQLHKKNDILNFFDDNFDFKDPIVPIPEKINIQNNEEIQTLIDKINTEVQKKKLKALLTRSHKRTICYSALTNIYEDNLRAVLFAWAIVIAVISFIGCQILFKLLAFLFSLISQIDPYKISVFYIVFSVGLKSIILFYLLRFIYNSTKDS